MPVYCSTEEEATALRAQNLNDVRICDTNGCAIFDSSPEYAVVSSLIAECPVSKKKRTDLVLKRFKNNYLDFSKPHFIKYSAREVEISLRLRHNNLAYPEGIYVRQKNDAYLIAGLVFEHHGIELCDYIAEERENGIISTSKVVKIATQIASALQFMHDQVPPVIHRDVKPNKILVSERDGYPHVKLIGFGLSCAVADLMTANLTEHSYTAPEMFATEREETNYTTAVDIYSFGMVLYFMTVGNDPFPEFRRHTKDFGKYINSPNEDGNYPRPEFHATYEYPESLKKLIKDCWKHTPEERLGWDQINDILSAIPE